MLTHTQYKNLVDELNLANKEYYQRHNSIMTDPEFDLKLEELTEFESQNPKLKSPKSPTLKVGNDLVKGFVKRQHSTPMLSIAKVFSYDDLRKWMLNIEEKIGEAGCKFIAELKLDGCSLSLIYEDGKLIRAVSRGNGTEGDDVTQNVLQIKSIPKTIFSKHKTEIRGECIIFKSDFEDINSDLVKRHQKTYENPRNLTSGSLKLKDPVECGKRKISFIAYNILDGGSEFHTQDFQLLLDFGFKIPEHAYVTIKDVHKYCDELMNKRNDLKMEIDGVCIKYNYKPDHVMLAGTRKTPGWLIAYKFPAEEAVGIITSVDHQIGRNGSCTPVANFDPGIKLAGVTIRRATLHNYEECERLGIAVDDMVRVQRRGEVIPKIMGLYKKISKQNKIIPPVNCPSCGSRIEKVDGEVAYKCMNHENCPAQILHKFVKFCMKDSMDMKGFAVESLDKIIDAELVENVSDLYDLTEQSLLNIGFGQTQSKNIISAIQSSKNAGLERLLIGIGLPQSGNGTCADLASYFKSMDKLLNATEEDFIKVGGIKNRAKDLYDWFHDDKNIQIISELNGYGVKMTINEKENKMTTSKLAGKSFVITGKLSKKRDEFQDIITENGGTFMSAVSAKTNYLLAGMDTGANKTAAANKHGTIILDEDQFWQMLN